MIIKAKFKGTNSLGYVHGKQYTLHFLVLPENPSEGYYSDYIQIEPIRERLCERCNYLDLHLFLENWEILKK